MGARIAALCLLQVFFTLSWTVYVIFLPALAAKAGIAKEAVLWILMLDQAIFAVMDWALGAQADRTAAHLRRLGPWIAAVTALSTAAFLALPFTALSGSAIAFLAVVIAWSASSSVLRVPPLVLLARGADLSARPAIAGAFMFGIGIAGAAAPFVALALSGVDARLAFALSSFAVLVATIALVRMPASPQMPVAVRNARARPGTGLFLAAALLLAAGFQVHFALTAAPRYLQFVPLSQLPWLLPLFWAGFNIAIFPAMAGLRRVGALPTMAMGAALAAVGALVAAQATALGPLVAAETAAGAGWGLAMVGVLAAAMELGTTGREGFVAGGAFALFAVAVFGRIAFVALQFPVDAATRPLLQLFAAAAWVAAVVVLVAAARRLRAAVAT
jgi:hypothetical protein